MKGTKIVTSKARTGVYAAAATPFTEAGSVDLSKLTEHCQRLIDQGLDGVAPLGTTGEGNSVSHAERLVVPEAFAKAGLESSRVIFGTGVCAPVDTVVLTRACLDAGFSNVLVLPPFYYKSVSDDGLYDHFARVIDAVGSEQLRLYLYHFPQMSQTPISTGLIARLKAAFGPAIAGLKDSSGDYASTLRFASCAEDFDVFPSNEAVLVDALDKGCRGVISATTNTSAPLARRVLEASEAEQEHLQILLAQVRETISRFPLVAAVKATIALQTDDAQWQRVSPPLRRLDRDAYADLKASLSGLPSEAGIL